MVDEVLLKIGIYCRRPPTTLGITGFGSRITRSAYGFALLALR